MASAVESNGKICLHSLSFEIGTYVTHECVHAELCSALVGAGHTLMRAAGSPSRCRDPTKAITSWKVAWTTARTAAGVDCRFHDLRHTCVARLLERGHSFAVVATIMGWSPGTSVRLAKRYGHIGQSIQRAAMASLDAQPELKKGEQAKPRAPKALMVQAPTTIQ
jgi:hypothetical protein